MNNLDVSLLTKYYLKQYYLLSIQCKNKENQEVIVVFQAFIYMPIIVVLFIENCVIVKYHHPLRPLFRLAFMWFGQRKECNNSHHCLQ